MLYYMCILLKAFTYDHVYEMDSVQEDVYADTVHGLIEGCFEG